MLRKRKREERSCLRGRMIFERGRRGGRGGEARLGDGRDILGTRCGCLGRWGGGGRKGRGRKGREGCPGETRGRGREGGNLCGERDWKERKGRGSGPVDKRKRL